MTLETNIPGIGHLSLSLGKRPLLLDNQTIIVQGHSYNRKGGNLDIEMTLDKGASYSTSGRGQRWEMYCFGSEGNYIGGTRGCSIVSGDDDDDMSESQIIAHPELKSYFSKAINVVKRTTNDRLFINGMTHSSTLFLCFRLLLSEEEARNFDNATFKTCAQHLTEFDHAHSSLLSSPCFLRYSIYINFTI